MGTTAEKGARVLQSIAEVQEGINNLGGSLTDQTPFKDFKAQLDEIYNNLPKTEYQEGTEVTLSNTLKGKLDFEKIYQEVEYIESTGTQYIDTGVIPNTNTKIDIEFETIAKGNYGIIFGGEPSAFSNCFHLYNTDGKFDIGFGSKSQGFKTEIIYNTNTKYRLLLDKNGFDINGETEAFTSQAISSTYNIYLFADKRDSVLTDANAQKRIYYCKLYDNNILVRDFIPCYRKSDNVLGLYDKVEGKFYTNAGTDTFTKGADVGNGFDEIVGIGQTEQDSTQGYQLLNITATSGTKNGATWTVNEDKSITISTSGATTGLVTIPIVASKTLSAGTYYASGVTGGTENTYYFGILKNDWVFRNFNGITQFSVSEQTSYSQIWIVIATGTTISTPITIYPMISKVNTSNYEQYSGGYSSPSPNWEQQVKCVAGKNKLDYTNNTIADSYIDTQLNKIYPISGATTTWFKATPHTTYTMSREKGNRLVIAGMNTLPALNATLDGIIYNGSSDTSTEYTFYNENYKYIVLYIARDIANKPSWVQVEEGTQATPYLPYNTIQEVVRGKNLFDDSSHKNKDVPSSAGFYINNAPFNLSGGTYRFGVFVDNQLITTPALMALSFKSGGTTVLEKNAPNQDITITDEQASIIDRVSLYFNGTFVSTYSGKKITGVMITTSEITTYEPYITPKTYQFSLGDKELFEECTIVGSPDNWKYLDNWYKLTSSVLSGLTIGLSGSDGKKFVIVKSNFVGVPAPKVGKVYCTHLKYNPSAWYADGYCGIVSPGATLWLQMTQAFESVEAFKSFITTNNMEIVYQTEEPVETPITDTTLIEQLNNWYYGQSLDGTTIIEGNGDLPMIIKVRGLKGE